MNDLYDVLDDAGAIAAMEEYDFTNEEVVDFINHDNTGYYNVSREFALEQGAPEELFAAALTAQELI